MAPVQRPLAIRPKINKSQKALLQQKRLDLVNDLDQSKQGLYEDINEISHKHGRSKKWIKKQLYMGFCSLTKSRRLSIWNAFLQQRLRDENEGRNRGDRYRLPDFIRQNKKTLLRAYSKLTPDEKQGLLSHLSIARTTKVKMPRSNPKAIQHDINATFNAMETEWGSICQRTGAEGFYFVVRGDVHDYHEPKVFASAKAMQFIKTVLGMEPKELALRFEGWCVSGINMPGLSNRQRPLQKIIGECRKLIQDGLVDIVAKHGLSKKKRVIMNYNNYKSKIVETYGVALDGWPKGTVQNPGTIGGRSVVTALLEKLQSGACYWTKLTAEELEQHISNNKACAAAGESIYKPRKSRRPKGKSAAVIDDDDEEEEEDTETPSGSSQGDEDNARD